MEDVLYIESVLKSKLWSRNFQKLPTIKNNQPSSMLTTTLTLICCILIEASLGSQKIFKDPLDIQQNQTVNLNTPPVIQLDGVQPLIHQTQSPLDLVTGRSQFPLGSPSNPHWCRRRGRRTFRRAAASQANTTSPGSPNLTPPSLHLSSPQKSRCTRSTIPLNPIHGKAKQFLESFLNGNISLAVLQTKPIRLDYRDALYVLDQKYDIDFKYSVPYDQMGITPERLEDPFLFWMIHQAERRCSNLRKFYDICLNSKENDLTLIQNLIEICRADPSPILFYAVKQINLNVRAIKYLLAHGAKTNYIGGRPQYGVTPLFMTLSIMRSPLQRDKLLNVTKSLVEYGANIHYVCRNIENQRWVGKSIAQVLRQQGINDNSPTGYHLAIAKKLIKQQKKW